MTGPGLYLLAGTVVAAGVLSLPCSTLAQEGPTVVPDAPSCPDCGYRLSLEATLGDDEGPGALGGAPAAVARVSRGRLFVVDWGTADFVRVFDSGGRYLLDLGRPGEGPRSLVAARQMPHPPGASLVSRRRWRSVASTRIATATTVTTPA